MCKQLPPQPAGDCWVASPHILKACKDSFNALPQQIFCFLYCIEKTIIYFCAEQPGKNQQNPNTYKEFKMQIESKKRRHRKKMRTKNKCNKKYFFFETGT